MGVGHLASQLSFSRDEPTRLAFGRVWAGDGDALDFVGRFEHLSHRGDNLRIIDTLVGDKHNGARCAAPESIEIDVKRVETTLGLRIGDREGLSAGRANCADKSEYGRHDRDPGAQDQPVATE